MVWVREVTVDEWSTGAPIAQPQDAAVQKPLPGEASYQSLRADPKSRHQCVKLHDGFTRGLQSHIALARSTWRLRLRKAASISEYEKLASRPLGFGRTKTAASPRRSVCSPSATGPRRSGNIALN